MDEWIKSFTWESGEGGGIIHGQSKLKLSIRNWTRLIRTKLEKYFLKSS